MTGIAGNVRAGPVDPIVVTVKRNKDVFVFLERVQVKLRVIRVRTSATALDSARVSTEPAKDVFDCFWGVAPVLIEACGDASGGIQRRSPEPGRTRRTRQGEHSGLAN